MSSDRIRPIGWGYTHCPYPGGEFWKAWERAEGFSTEAHPSSRVLQLSERLAFLLGHYGTAERLFGQLVIATQQEVSAKLAALVDLLFCYYEQNQFDAIKALPFPAGVELPHYDIVGELPERNG